MPAENLTRVEAQERAALIKVDSYRVELDLTTGDETFLSTTRVAFSSNRVDASTFIDAITGKVHSVVLNGKSLDVQSVADGVRIQLDHLAAENELVVISDCNFMNTGEGLHRFVDPVDNEVYLYTQFEVPDSRRVFAVFEQPDLKATFQFTVTAPARWKLISNSPTPEPMQLENEKALWSFEATPPISSYITALVAGPYDELRSELKSTSGRVIPLGLFFRKSLAQFVDADYIFEKTRQGFEFFEKQFDVPYPFAKYDQLFVPEFNAGAMENAGAVTITETYVFRANVTDFVRERRVITVLHELAHMWFGDLVTMRWWNDLWLNESFAEYVSHVATVDATEWTDAWTTFATLEKGGAYVADQLPSTHPIVAEINDLEDVQVNFDQITYGKGAAVLRQLVAWVGQDRFMAGVSSYLKKHAFSNTELPDLLTELEAQSGRELKSWSKLWLETAGVNTLRPSVKVNGEGVIESFDVLQTAISAHPSIRPHRMAIGFYNQVDGALVRQYRTEIDVDGETTSVPELAGRQRPALILLNDGDLAYAKIRFDEESWTTAVEQLSLVDNSLARALIWNSAWDSTRDGETAPRDYIRMVLQNIGAETHSATLLTILRALSTAAKLYVSSENREGTWIEVADGLLRLARTAVAGSDSQLQLVKSFALFARTPEQLATLRAILEGRDELVGLQVDTDLRWELLTGLAVAGHTSEDEIEAELAKDNTSNGQRFAAAARAALPAAAAKAAAWHQLVETDELSNTLVSSASMGFSRVIDSEILKPYVAKYFDSVMQIWESKTFKIAEYLLKNLYPSLLASQELAKATKTWISQNDFSDKAALKRIMVENLAGLERALVAQEVDRSI